MPRFVLFAKHRHHVRAVLDVHRLERIYDFRQANFGNELMDEAAKGIMWNCVQERNWNGAPWPPLSPKYLIFKVQTAPGKPMGVLYGVMLTWEQLRGERRITPTHCYQIYGINGQARYEADQFQQGGLINGTRQPPRPFYGFTSEALDDMKHLAEQKLANFVVTT